MKKSDWNPELYLKYVQERTQPSNDLVARLNGFKAKSIIDIGCGPGNSTQVLTQQWPNASVLGVDSSPAMIEKAKFDYPNQVWEVLNVGVDKIEESYDLVFSNATIQWIPDHLNLYKQLSAIMTEKGKLAVQFPLFFDMPLGKALVNISSEKQWSDKFKNVRSLFVMPDKETTYDYLAAFFSHIEIWETNYVHVYDSHASIFEMIQSTALKPYFERIVNPEDRMVFDEEVLESIKRDYPLQQNGKVLFPFKRLFFVAKK